MFFLGGDLIQAEKAWHEGLEIADQLEDQETIAGLLMNLGQVAFLEADYEGAEVYFQIRVGDVLAEAKSSLARSLRD